MVNKMASLKANNLYAKALTTSRGPSDNQAEVLQEGDGEGCPLSKQARWYIPWHFLPLNLQCDVSTRRHMGVCVDVFMQHYSPDHSA